MTSEEQFLAIQTNLDLVLKETHLALGKIGMVATDLHLLRTRLELGGGLKQRVEILEAAQADDREAILRVEGVLDRLLVSLHMDRDEDARAIPSESEDG